MPQQNSNPGISAQVTNLIDGTSNIVGGSLANLLMGIAFVVFLLAVINFIWKRRGGGGGYGRDNGLSDAKNMLGWSIMALFVMVSIWGIVYFISSNLGVDQTNSARRPQTCFGSGCNIQNSASVRP